MPKSGNKPAAKAASKGAARPGKKSQKKSAKAGKAGKADALAKLRKDIDRLDADLHKLIRKRAHLVSKVGAAKQQVDAPVHRPAREAQILRSLVKRHKGEFPPAALLAIWREIIAASVRLQSDFRVAVPARGAWQEALARGHFGAATPYVTSSNPLGALAQKRATAAILPAPGRTGAGLWWRRLGRAEFDGVQVLWRLPFAGDGRSAYIVGRGLTGPSGDDLTWLMAEMPAEADDPAGMRTIASYTTRSKRGAAGAPTALRLLESDGYISAADAADAVPGGAGPVHWLGAFPRPLGDMEAGST